MRHPHGFVRVARGRIRARLPGRWPVVVGALPLALLLALLASTDGASSASPPNAGSARFGMALGSAPAGMSAGRLDAVMADASSLGLGWVRVGLSWAEVQPFSPAQSDWSEFDRVVQAAAANHLKVLAVVGFTPAWARPRGCSSYRCHPADPARFAAFVRQAAARYESRVGAWEIWNEPNLERFWLPAPDPAQYAALLEAAADAIHGVMPQAPVVSGGLAMVPSSRQAVSGLDFLSRVCAAGALSAVDGVGIHPYSYPVPPGYYAPWSGWSQLAETPVNVESVLAGCGQGDQPLWLTEYGAPTDGPGPAASRTDYMLAAHPNHVTPGLQAEMATQSVQAVESSSRVAALFWYTDQDSSLTPVSNSGFFGLRTKGGARKPAWAALAKAVQQAPGS